MRLFLLSFNGHVLAIELDDIDSGAGTLRRLTETALNLRFRGCG